MRSSSAYVNTSYRSIALIALNSKLPNYSLAKSLPLNRRDYEFCNGLKIARLVWILFNWACPMLKFIPNFRLNAA